MSNIKVQGNASGAGTTTLQSPNTATSATLTLPDVASADTLAAIGYAQTFSAVQTFSADCIFSSTGAITVSKGTTAQRPTAVTGMLRYNTSTNAFEGYSGASPSWQSLGSGGSSTGGTGSNIFLDTLFSGM